MFQSILGKKKFEYRELEEPECFRDLNLRQLTRTIMAERPGYDLTPYFYEMNIDKEDIIYRHEVMRDLEHEAVYKAVTDFSVCMCQLQKYLEYYETVPFDVQKNCWLLNAASLYGEGLLTLQQALAGAELQSEGMKEFLSYLSERVASNDFMDMLAKSREIKQKLQEIRFTLDVKKDKIFILPTVDESCYTQSIQQFFLKNEGLDNEAERAENSGMMIPLLLDGKLELTELEQSIIKRIEEKNAAVFKQLQDFKLITPDFVPAAIKEYHNEVQFYLAFLRFRNDMRRFGFSFTYPEFSEEPPCMKGFYDLALAYKNAYEGTAVIVNDAHYREKELFFVVTGPNQGGKTTFARALGQIVYFSKIGLPVAGEFCRLPLFAGIMTHFEMEESMMSGEGKLKEELGRLKPMLEKTDTKQFVIINELFTTAATYDATIMGKRVLEHFVKDCCYGIYVTHIAELAEETGQVVSLVAGVDQASGARTFQIRRKKAEGNGYATALVEKYRLSYHDLMERL